MTKREERFPLPEHGKQVTIHGVTFTAEDGLKYRSATNMYCIWNGGAKGGRFYQNLHWGYVPVESGMAHRPDRDAVAAECIEGARRRYEAAKQLVAEYEA